MLRTPQLSLVVHPTGMSVYFLLLIFSFLSLLLFSLFLFLVYCDRRRCRRVRGRAVIVAVLFDRAHVHRGGERVRGHDSDNDRSCGCVLC